MIGVRDPQKDTSLRARRTSIGLKDAAKWHEGCTRPAIADTHRASWLRASRHEDRPMGPEARGHAAWWTPPSRHKEPPLRESPTPMGPHGHEETTRRTRRSRERPAAVGSHRFREATRRCTASRVAPGHAPSSTRRSALRAPAIPEEGRRFGCASSAPPEKGCVSLSGRLTNEREGRVSPLVAFWLARKLAYRRALKARQPGR